eukprot:4707153-Alexandrium_andersonii.AAC.1
MGVSRRPWVAAAAGGHVRGHLHHLVRAPLCTGPPATTSCWSPSSCWPWCPGSRSWLASWPAAASRRPLEARPP